MQNTESLIEQVWQYGKERRAEFFSQYISNVEYYADGHYMVHSGSIGYFDGETAEKMVVNEPNDPKCEERSITVEVLNNKVMLELELNRNYYRTEKMKLFDENESLIFGPGKELGSLGITKEYEKEFSAVEVKELIPESFSSSLLEQEDRILFEINLKEGQFALLLLEKNGEIHKYFMPAAKANINAFCAGDFIHPHLRNTALTVSKGGLKGQYDVKVVIEEKKYQTGLTIFC